MKEYEKTDLLGMKKILVRQTPVMQDGLLPHCHTHLQISVCLKGSGVYTIGKNRYPVTQGDVVLLNRLVNHNCIPDNGEQTVFIFFEFTEDFIAPQGSSEFQYQYLQPFRYDPQRINPWISHDEPVAAEVKRLVEDLKAIYDSQRPGYEHEMDAVMKLVMAKLRSYYLTKYPDEFLSKHVNSVGMNEALNYVNHHYMENIRIEAIAEILNVSESRFRHIFKEIMHISVKSYITLLRVAEAQKLLATTDMTIDNIAFHCGFGNITHFYKTFKEHAHVTPSEYRAISLDYSGDDAIDHFKL
jgi:AraC-like DNA-binding protein